MHDRKAHLLNAEDAVWAHPANAVVGTLEAHRLINEAVATLGVGPLTVEFSEDGDLKTFDGGVRVPAWARTPIGMMHVVAHAATDPVFPAHGAEFCANVLRILPSALSAALASELDARGVHRAPEQRVRQSRREVVVAAKRGGPVEMVFDDPPEMIVSSIDTVQRTEIRLCDGRCVALERLRYAAVA